MEARDFIYNFTDTLFSQIVRSTILIENWEEGDFDYRYAEYADIFIKMKEGYMGQSDEKVAEMFRNSKKTVVKNFNDKMRENFIKELEKNGANAAIFDQLLSSEMLKEDSVNVNSLDCFRQFEERTFTQRPKNGV